MCAPTVQQILVVDDISAMVRLVPVTLEQEGSTVASAGSRAEAIGLLEQWSPHLPARFLLDVHIPVMDGWQFIDALCQLLDACLPIAVMSTSSDFDAWAHQIGAQGLLRKPFDVSLLLTMSEVRRLLWSLAAPPNTGRGHLLPWSMGRR